MDLPYSVVINSLDEFSICFFKDAKHSPEAPPHFYVTIPVAANSGLLVSIITSQVENKTKYYNKVNGKAVNSLIEVDSRDLIGICFFGVY